MRFAARVLNGFLVVGKAAIGCLFGWSFMCGLVELNGIYLWLFVITYIGIAVWWLGGMV